MFWLGHSSFLIKGKQAIVVTDPFDEIQGYNLGKPYADIITISHQHSHHNFEKGIEGNPWVIKGPGEYEIANVFVTGIRTFHDNVMGEKYGENTVYLIEIDNVRLCHLGDIGHKLTSTQIEELSDVDVLLVPVGGVTTINAPLAAETINMIDPTIVIPMHYRTEAVNLDLETIEPFLKEMGIKEVVQQPKLSFNKSSLANVTQLVVLDYNR